jgi:hypothetical protein
LTDLALESFRTTYKLFSFVHFASHNGPPRDVMNVKVAIAGLAFVAFLVWVFTH